MESSGKSNSRVILGAQRARNKTVLMGADQLEALRSEADASSVIEGVSDLLGVVEPSIEPDGAHHADFDGSLLDALPDEEEGAVGAQTEILSTDDSLKEFVSDPSPLDFGDTFESSPDTGLDASYEPMVESEGLREARDGVDDSEREDAPPTELPCEEPSKLERSRIVRVGSAAIPAAEVAPEEEIVEESNDALDLREDSGQTEQAKRPKYRGVMTEHLRQKRGCRDALVGFLVSFDDNPRGEFVELREGRMIVTSESVGAAPCLLLAHPSVCPMHAIMKIVSGEPLHILDQLSELGTRIVHLDSGREERLSGDKGIARHGDVVYFGERKFHVCLVSVEMDDSE